MCKQMNATIGPYPIICTHHKTAQWKRNKTELSRIYMKPTAFDGTTTSATQQGNMTTMGKIDISGDDNTIVANISSRSPKLQWASLTHTTPHIAKKIKKVTESTNYILETLSTEYTQQAFTRVS